jgi:hypothetical protein
VVVDACGELDQEATDARRAALAADDSPPPGKLEVDSAHLRMARALAEYVKPPA